MEETELVLERHAQLLRALERDVADLKAVQAEICSMNETLVTLATELKYANAHLTRHEQKLDELERRPGARLGQLITALVAALAGGLVSVTLERLFA